MTEKLIFDRRAVLALGLLCLSGCGFHPVYGPGATGKPGPQRDMSQVQVALIPERAGQLLRQALQQRLDRGEGLRKRYELAVSYSIVVDVAGYQVDSSVTRERLVATGNWTLKTLETGATIASGIARSLDGLDVLDQQYFAADIANETAQRRLAETIASNITLQVAAYFDRSRAAG